MRWLSLVACLLAACSDRGKPIERSAPVTMITVAGSTAMVPLTTEAAIRFMKAHPDVVVQVSAGGSKVGLSQVASGAVTIGASDVQADPEQARGLEDHRVAVVGFAVVSARAPYNQAVRSLSRAQVKAIFTGKARDWSELGGAHQPIVVVNRKPSSGTRAVFGDLMLGGDHFLLGAQEEDSSSMVQNLLLGQVGAISYLGLSYSHPQLRAYPLDEVPPTVEAIETGQYPLWSYEHLYTRGPAQGVARAFLDFLLSPAMQTELPRLGFIPVKDMHPAHDRDPRY